jgi:hypothetical protein
MEIQRSKAIEIQQIEIQQTPFGLGFVDLSNHGQEKKEEKKKNLLFNFTNISTISIAVFRER